MTNRNNTINVPEARSAMDRFKMEAANDECVPAPSYRTQQKSCKNLHKIDK